MTDALRVFGAGAIALAAIALLHPRPRSVLDSYFASARERWGMRANPLQKTSVFVISLMLLFFAVAVVLSR